LKKLVNRFIKTFRKKSFEDSVILLVTFLIKTYCSGSIDSKKTLLPIVYASCMGISITNAVKRLKRKGYEVHSNKTILDKIAEFDADVIEQMITQAREIVLSVAKRFGFCNRRTIVSIDFHDKPFYGDRHLKEIVGTKKKAGTCFAYRYATICICEEGIRFNLATMAVTQLHLKKDVVAELIREARKYVAVGLVLLDRGFNGTEIFEIIKDERTRYVMPLIKYSKVKELCNQTKKEVDVIEYIFYENRAVEYQTKVKVIVDKREKTHYFVTNIQEETKTILTLIIEAYRKRWGIETGYRVADEFYAMTTSIKFSTRCFLNLLSFLLQDLWTLRNFIETNETNLQQPRSRFLKGCRTLIRFIRKSVKKLNFYYRPSLEAELFREDLIDCVKERLD